MIKAFTLEEKWALKRRDGDKQNSSLRAKSVEVV